MSDEKLSQSIPGSAVTILVEVEECFNYAAWQNSVPLLRSVVVENLSQEELSSIELELKVSPSFARQKSWKIDRVAPGQQVALRDIDLDIDPEYLDLLDEAVRGELSFRLQKGDQTVAERSVSVRVLARDEWGGMNSMGPLLPAFVTPNDPALSSLLKSTSEVLVRHGHSGALDGYQTGDPNRAFLLTAALWSAVGAKSLTYANPPSSFEQVGQKTRRVSTVLGEGLATCLDTTLMFASGLESLGLHPILVMTEGHCFVGVWLVEKTLNRLCEPDCSEIRKALAAKELIVFETTLVTHRPAAQFKNAMSEAASAISESREGEFVAAIDVARARMAQVRPIASHSNRSSNEQNDATQVEPPSLPASPGYERPAVKEPEPMPQSPAGRIERWQRKLLDLSLRNRLLNFRPSKQTVPVLCENVSRLEDRLADGARMRLVSLKEENKVVDRDAALHQQRTQKDLDLEFAREALDRDEVACPVEASDLNGRLTALFRKVKNDLSEGGSNTLYLAVGFLRWKQNAIDEKTYRAPLLLVPVKLLRRSASSPFYLAHHEDEVRFNATLLQLLKKDFDCDLTSMDSNLPTDDSGVDVPKVMDQMRRAVRDIPGFEVVEEAAIGSFSFMKYLMWKDLVERVGQLEHNRVVRHLVNDPDKPFEGGGSGTMPVPDDIDVRYLPSDLVHPLPADSSQLAAVMAASEGHDLVIVGPPGTGKSQTIANVIAQCLAVDKTVLFVAEKTAALDVVHRRLRNHGLGDCCVELHSNKAERRRFLDQLQASWTRRARPKENEWIEINERLRIRRDELNAYVEAIHKEHPNGWTVYNAMGLCVRERDSQSPELPWPRTVSHDHSAYESITKSIDDLNLAFRALPSDANLGQLNTTTWSMAWESDLLASCARLKDVANNLLGSIEEVSKKLNLPLPVDISSAQLSVLYRVAHELTRVDDTIRLLLPHQQLEQLKGLLNTRRDLLSRREQANETLDQCLTAFAATLGLEAGGRIGEEQRPAYFQLANELVKPGLPPSVLVFHPNLDNLPGILTRRSELTKRFEETSEAVEARCYNPTLVKRIKIDDLEAAWNKASNSFWPLSIIRKRSVNKKLRAYMKPKGVADPDIDLPILREQHDCLKSLSENMASLGLSPELENAIEQDTSSLGPLIGQARSLRESLLSTGNSLEAIRESTNESYDKLIAAARKVHPILHELEQLRWSLRENLVELCMPPELESIVKEEPGALDSPIDAALRLRNASSPLGISIEELSSAIHSLTKESRISAANCCRSAKAFQDAWVEYTKLAMATPVEAESTTIVSDAAAQADQVISNRRLLKQWTAWNAARKQAEGYKLTQFVEGLENGSIAVDELTSLFKLSFARWWLTSAVDQSDTLRTFQRFRHEDAVDDFRKLDELAREAASTRVLQTIQHDLPPSDEVPRKSELGLLRHQMGLKRPSKSIREVISGMPESFGKLAPCLLMSPLSIAQYLPADQAQFDIVVFDEASQIATWDAIGAIARGKQTIIVGDPKQLPPTNFFGKADSDEDDDEIDDHEKDLESILDEAQASGLPTLQLNWHYRSRHESLIAFSNYNYYQNKLVTFPAAESEDRGVSLTYIEGGLYDRGKSRTNRAEAEAIVADVVARMKRCMSQPERDRLTYGIVTFNIQQQTLILDLIDQALRDAPELEWFFAEERIEPTIVKNLENVQGDERDVMYFSITFGKDAAGKFPVDFGAINRDGGERRLNVAVTRARQTLLVYASFLPDELRSERSSARGVHDLKAFLQFAHNGSDALFARTDGSVGEMESPFEEAVAEALERLGWRLDPQVGVSGFRVDLGVIHPDRPGAYLAGVECDGATYHRSAAARDRDKTRQQVLENLGWNILRVWSSDWWYDPHSAIEELHTQLNELLQASREGNESSVGLEQYSRESKTSEDVQPSQQVHCDIASVPDLSADSESPLSVSHPKLVARHSAEGSSSSVYPITMLRNAIEEQDKFFDDNYTAELRQMASAVVETEGPVRDDVLARRIARAHGFARTGARIKKRLLGLLSDVTTTTEDAGRFFWPIDTPPKTVAFRYPSPTGEQRSLDEIPMQELLGLIEARTDLAASEDPALAIAREMGLARLSNPTRQRLETALELAESLQSGDDL